MRQRMQARDFSGCPLRLDVGEVEPAVYRSERSSAIHPPLISGEGGAL
jgi:hypothetical protein